MHSCALNMFCVLLTRVVAMLQGSVQAVACLCGSFGTRPYSPLLLLLLPPPPLPVIITTFSH